MPEILVYSSADLLSLQPAPLPQHAMDWIRRCPAGARRKNKRRRGKRAGRKFRKLEKSPPSTSSPAIALTAKNNQTTNNNGNDQHTTSSSVDSHNGYNSTSSFEVIPDRSLQGNPSPSSAHLHYVNTPSTHRFDLAQQAATEQGPAGANPGPRDPPPTDPRNATSTSHLRSQSTLFSLDTNNLSSLKVGTLNARTLKAEWRLKEAVSLMMDLKMDILAIIETRRKDHYDAVEAGFTLKCYPADDAGVGGIGFLFSPRIWPLVLDINLGPRLSTAAISMKDRRLVMACAYSPTAVATAANPAATHAFYTSLTSLCNTTARRDLLLIAGHLNAPLDCDGVAVTILALGQENINSALLRSFVDGNGLFLINGKFRQHPSRANTFHGPNKRVTRLDWTMTRAHHCHFITGSKTTKLRVLRSDHSLLSVNINMKWQFRRKPHPQPLWLALSERRQANRYRIKVNHHQVETASDLANAIRDAATILPQRQAQRPSHPWLDNTRIEQLRRTLQSLRSRHGHDDAQVTAAQSELEEAHKQAANNHISDVVARLQEAHANGKTRLAWQIINSASGRTARHRAIIPADSLDDRLTKIADHYSALLNRSTSSPLTLEPDYPDHPEDAYSTSSVSFAEVRRALSATKLDGAPGPDGIPARALTPLVSNVVKVINHHSAINQGHPPPIWRQSEIVSIPKKGSSVSLDNLRGISLMCSCPKISNRIMLKRIQTPIMDRISPLQAGFIPAQSTLQQISALRMLIDDCRKYQRNVSIVFIDFKKAFDSESRSAIPLCLSSHGVPDILIQTIMDLYDSTTATANIDGSNSCSFSTSSGVLQGDTLAPFLFVVILDAVLRDAKLEGYTVRRRRSSRHLEVRLPYLAFADDVALLSDTPEAAQEATNRLFFSAEKVGLSINHRKSEVLHIGQTSPPAVTLPTGEILKQVSDFTYLGATMSNADKAVESRRRLAWTAAHKLSTLLHSPASDSLKLALFSSAIEPVLLYGLEAVALTDTRTATVNQTHRSLARYALGIQYPTIVSNAALKEKGVRDASATLDTKRANLKAKSSNGSALSIMLSYPPTEKLRRGMAHLKSLREQF